MITLEKLRQTRIQHPGARINDLYFSYLYDDVQYNIDFYSPWYVVKTRLGDFRYATLEDAETFLFLLLSGLGSDRH